MAITDNWSTTPRSERKAEFVKNAMDNDSNLTEHDARKQFRQTNRAFNQYNRVKNRLINQGADERNLDTFNVNNPNQFKDVKRLYKKDFGYNNKLANYYGATIEHNAYRDFHDNGLINKLNDEAQTVFSNYNQRQFDEKYDNDRLAAYRGKLNIRQNSSPSFDELDAQEIVDPEIEETKGWFQEEKARREKEAAARRAEEARIRQERLKHNDPTPTPTNPTPTPTNPTPQETPSTTPGNGQQNGPYRDAAPFYGYGPFGQTLENINDQDRTPDYKKNRRDWWNGKSWLRRTLNLSNDETGMLSDMKINVRDEYIRKYGKDWAFNKDLVKQFREEVKNRFIQNFGRPTHRGVINYFNGVGPIM